MPVARAGITEIPQIYEEFILVLSTANFSLVIVVDPKRPRLLY
ncbi:MAG: hypothetical protein WCF66_24020 [Pseudolabrys sp.]|jgi:hypothetical protein